MPSFNIVRFVWRILGRGWGKKPRKSLSWIDLRIILKILRIYEQRFCNISILHCCWSSCEMLLKDFNFDCSTVLNYINASSSSWYFIMKFDYMSRRAILQNTLQQNCFCHLISFRTTSMIRGKKNHAGIFFQDYLWFWHLDPLLYNGLIFVFRRVQSSVCHSRKMAAETPESLIRKPWAYWCWPKNILCL